MAQLAGEPVHQQQCGALSAFHHMQPCAGDLDEASLRRQCRLHAAHGAQGEEREPGLDGEDYGQCREQERHA